MMIQISIRQATLADVDGVLSCLHEAFAPYRDAYTPEGFTDTTLTDETIRRRLREMHVLVAVTAGDDVVGTVAGVANGDEGHIRGMAVRPQWAGSGVARKLLDAVEAELRACRCTRVTLDTTEPLQRATRFYEKNGYRKTGRVGDFFGMRLIEYAKHL
jgi:[ribosomal protein S18]-alanine N-acetyltransferase